MRSDNGTIRGSGFLGVLILSGALFGQGAEPALEQRLDQLEREYERRVSRMEERYELRLGELRAEIDSLRGTLDARTSDDFNARLETRINEVLGTQGGDRVGIGQLGQATIFDNAFNPAISLVGDFVLSASSAEDSFEQLNRFGLRLLELGITGRVDPHLAYYFVLFAGEGELEVEEAYGHLDQGLPDTFTLKFGRYNMDFGRLSRFHDHDLPFLDKPGVLQEFISGSLRGTGIEVHHWVPIGESEVLRWSAGIVNDLGGEAHAVLGPLAAEEHEEEGAEPFGERGFDDFAFNARVAAKLEVGTESDLLIGASGAWAPTGRSFFEDPMTGGVVAADLESLTLGIDTTYEWLDPATGEGLDIGAEFLLTDRTLHEEGTTETFDETALGFYVYGEYHHDKEWSFGASLDWFERVEDASKTWLDAGAFVTWHMSPFNRLRLEARWVDDELADREDFTVVLQWTTLLGSHGHGVAW